MTMLCNMRLEIFGRFVRRTALSSPFTAFAALFFIVFTSCEVHLPLMGKNVSTSFDLTSPYDFTINMGSSDVHSYFPVNQPGVSIKETRMLSNGTTEIILGGVAVANGIPQALHEVNYLNGAKDVLATDYPIGSIIASASNKELPLPVTAYRSIENCFSLKSTSTNSKYTVVTISGMLQNDNNNIQIREENESLRLLSNNYVMGFNAYSARFNSAQTPMTKEINYYVDPNYFTDSGKTPATTLYRGGDYSLQTQIGKQKGGFNILIWDGARIKRASYGISTDSGRTFSYVVIDWNNVRFADIPLQDVKWYDTPTYSTVDALSQGGRYRDIAIVGSAGLDYSSNVSIKAWDTDPILAQYPDGSPPPDSRAEGLQPEFFPANATNKNFFVTKTLADERGPLSVILDDGSAIVEVSDRICVTARRGVASGSGTAIVKIAIPNYTTNPASVQYVTLTLYVTVSARP